MFIKIVHNKKIVLVMGVMGVMGIIYKYHIFFQKFSSFVTINFK